MMLTGFLHDSGKESVTYQRAVEDFLAGEGSEPLDFGHQDEKNLELTVNSIKSELEDELLGIPNSEAMLCEIVWSIAQLGRRESGGSISQTFQRTPSKDALICKEIVHLADVLLSKVSAEDAAATPLDGDLTSKLSLAYSKVSTVRGLLTHFLHSALESQFTQKGFSPILWYPNGTVYLGRKGQETAFIDEAGLVETVRDKMHEVLGGNLQSKMAKAAFGGLTKQVIAAPEFLFADDKVIHSFWREFISQQRFANPKVKHLDELTDSERKLFKLIDDQMHDDKLTNEVRLARLLSDFNLLIVLFAIRKQVIDSATSDGKHLESETNQRIKDILSRALQFPKESMDDWPEIALQTKIEKRMSVAQSLWQSRFYDDPDDWRRRLLAALYDATLEMARIWRQIIPDKYESIAKHLIADVTSPINPEAMTSEVEEINRTIANGKRGHGTPICQKCGGVATLEAQAKLFGQSEIYNDGLVAGERVGGGNKIQVCELCDFEEKLRSVFVGRGQNISCFFVFPQLALSRLQQSQWRDTVNLLLFNQGEMPPLLRVSRWAERIIMDEAPSFAFSEKDMAAAIQYLAERDGLESDLSTMIEPGLDAKDGKSVYTLIHQGKCRLTEKHQKEVYELLNQLQPIYISPNFILVVTDGTVAERDEPESSVAIKWTLFQSLLAKLFFATVVPEEFYITEKVSQGYTPIPSNIILKPLVTKLGARRGWITIPKLEQSIRRLSGLILVGRELSREQVDYGRATLLRLLNEEPGRVLHRMTSKSNVKVPTKLIHLLDIWYFGK
jgi:hypothetical protein